MRVIQGWIYTWGSTHFGIDYIRGSGRTFAVVAAADGEACGNCVDGPGNKVWIKHTVGNTIYYTYYGHLATIESGIPLWSGATKKVTRGQKIGTAGNTGTSLIHLHFAVYNASWVAVDPYALYSPYPAYYPNASYRSMGANYLFTHDPPLYPSDAEISQPAEMNLPVSNYLPLILRRLRK
jgi:murein DD-endopeptidase MepM/ murein hydrolase activator NlpD